MGHPPGRAYVHVGLQKTGTSFLQSHLWDSPDALAAAGVRMVPAGRGPTFRVMNAVTGRLQQPRQAERVLDDLGRTVSEASEPTLLLSQESLASADEQQVARLLACFEGRETHLVVTARDVARQLPSMWQQKVKAKRALTFGEYLDLVREDAGAGRKFWNHQDLPAVLGRWTASLPPSQVHVVTCPPPGAARDVLARRFCALVGVDFDTLTSEDPRPNLGLDEAQVELVSRVNQLLSLPRQDHARTVKQFFAAQVLAPWRAGPVRTPRDLEGWCREVAERQQAAVQAAGYDVVGDLADLVPVDDAYGEDLAPVGDSDLARVAVAAIAGLLEDHNAVRHELEALRAELDALRDPDGLRDPGGGTT